MSHTRAGLITGSPLCGLCRRECIRVTKVFDGCITRIADQQFITTINGEGVGPYAFISEESHGETSVTNLAITPVGNSRESNVSFDAVIPVTVTYSDGGGIIHAENSTVTLHRDVVLKLPYSSVTPYEITVTTELRSVMGTFVSPTQVSCRVCLVQVCSVTSVVDMLVPSYGYANFPTCDENPCEGLNTTPLFPPYI